MLSGDFILFPCKNLSYLIHLGYKAANDSCIVKQFSVDLLCESNQNKTNCRVIYTSAVHIVGRQCFIHKALCPR